MIQYKVGYDVIDWASLMELYKAVDGVIGLANAGEEEIIKESFKNSFRIVTAWDGDRVVGAGRMLSDGYCYGWIHDVGVHPDYQKQGIGRGVIEALMEGDTPHLYGLTSSFTGIGFYESLGFRHHKTAMANYGLEDGVSPYLEGPGYKLEDD